LFVNHPRPFLELGFFSSLFQLESCIICISLDERMDTKEARIAQAQLGNAKEQDIHSVINQKGQTILVRDELKP